MKDFFYKAWCWGRAVSGSLSAGAGLFRAAFLPGQGCFGQPFRGHGAGSTSRSAVPGAASPGGRGSFPALIPHLSPPPLPNKLSSASARSRLLLRPQPGPQRRPGTAKPGRAFRGTAALRDGLRARCHHGRVPRAAPPLGTVPGLGTARLKGSVVQEDTEEWQKDPRFTGLHRVGGVDLSYIKGDESRACASLVVLSYPGLEVLYQDCRMVPVTAPYVAGFLAFREVPVLVEAVQRLQQEEPQLQPQVLLVDGNGLLHPRGFGIACHLGVLTDLPCIGVAKNLLQVDGLVRDELHREQVRSLQRSGETFPLTGTSGKVLGMADIRSREYLRKLPCAPRDVLEPASPESSKKEAELED
ncbi:endonuclease V isoform X4 [Parus major]|uniref:endonuclease V isoform X4 n=1 Tax=Parus major TaxID=9157 RepID=UPI0007711222|nr:endonuclease V isoform X4 [Parus major]